MINYQSRANSDGQTAGELHQRKSMPVPSLAMREFRFLAVVLGGVVAAGAVSVVLLGPVAWWIAPAVIDQMPPLDRVHAMEDIRWHLVQILIAAGVVGLIAYAGILQLRSVRRRRKFTALLDETADWLDDYDDEMVERLFGMWSKRLSEGEQGWERPTWLRQVLALLLVSEMHGRRGFDEVEHELMNALGSRVKYRAGEPYPIGDWSEGWRRQALTAMKAAYEKAANERPHLEYAETIDRPVGGQ